MMPRVESNKLRRRGHPLSGLMGMEVGAGSNGENSRDPKKQNQSDDFRALLRRLGRGIEHDAQGAGDYEPKRCKREQDASVLTPIQKKLAEGVSIEPGTSAEAKCSGPYPRHRAATAASARCICSCSETGPGLERSWARSGLC